MFIINFLLAFQVVCVQPDCTTSVVVTDCQDKPVSNATVLIETCKKKEKKFIVTNLKGEATFAICKDDICRINISVVGYSDKEIKRVSEVCKGQINTTCSIKICDE